MKKIFVFPILMSMVILFSGCSVSKWLGTEEVSGYDIKNKTPEELMKMAKDTDDIDLLIALSKHKNEGVRSDVAKNESLPANIQQQLALDKEWLVRNYLGANPNIDHEVANILMADTDQRVRWTVAKNPNTPESVMLELADDNSPQVLLKLVTNNGLTEKVMIKAAEIIPATVAIEMLKRDDITQPVIDVLMKRNDKKIREAIESKWNTENDDTMEFLGE